MSANGYQQLPRFLIYLVVQTGAVSCSEDVSSILASFNKAIRAKPPRTTLNRSITRLLRCRPTAIHELIGWISSDKVRDVLRAKGSDWVISQCIESFQKISQGTTPHKALGMHVPGRRRAMSITVTQDAAFLYKKLIELGSQSELAFKTAQDFREKCLPANSDVILYGRTLRAKCSEDSGSMEDFKIEHLEIKYKIKIHIQTGV